MDLSNFDMNKFSEGLAAQGAIPLALVDLLIEKGVITGKEYTAALDKRTNEMREEMERAREERRGE